MLPTLLIGQDSLLVPIENIKAANEVFLRLEKCQKDTSILNAIISEISHENILLISSTNEARNALNSCLELTEKQDSDINLCSLNLEIEKQEVKKYKFISYITSGTSLLFLLLLIL
jgi:acetolactate synthase small subunit